MPIDDATTWMIFVSALVAALTAVGIAWRRWVGPAARNLRDGAVLVRDGVRHIREVQDRELVNGSTVTLREEVAEINTKLNRDHQWQRSHEQVHERLARK